MPNSIRTPKLGKTQRSMTIAEAVDNEPWQRFRVSLKGKTTSEKLHMLQAYLRMGPSQDVEVRALRVENYLGALCRGGQLEPGINCKAAPLDLITFIKR